MSPDLTVAEAALLLEIAPRNVRLAIATGRLTARLVPRTGRGAGRGKGNWMIPAEEIERWRAGQAGAPESRAEQKTIGGSAASVSGQPIEGQDLFRRGVRPDLDARWDAATEAERAEAMRKLRIVQEAEAYVAANRREGKGRTALLKEYLATLAATSRQGG